MNYDVWVNIWQRYPIYLGVFGVYMGFDTTLV